MHLSQDKTFLIATSIKIPPQLDILMLKKTNILDFFLKVYHLVFSIVMDCIMKKCRLLITEILILIFLGQLMIVATL